MALLKFAAVLAMVSLQVMMMAQAVNGSGHAELPDWVEATGDPFLICVISCERNECYPDNHQWKAEDCGEGEGGSVRGYGGSVRPAPPGSTPCQLPTPQSQHPDFDSCAQGTQCNPSNTNFFNINFFRYCFGDCEDKCSKERWMNEQAGRLTSGVDEVTALDGNAHVGQTASGAADTGGGGNDAPVSWADGMLAVSALLFVAVFAAFVHVYARPQPAGTPFRAAEDGGEDAEGAYVSEL